MFSRADGRWIMNCGTANEEKRGGRDRVEVGVLGGGSQRDAGLGHKRSKDAMGLGKGE